ncbi:MAG: hypothetical protein E7315_06265 [Clostridiales bacterium]|nr:hypothetical protein [Clostridiales bacterium]
MLYEQISVFVENKKGKLAQITKVLEESNINLRALNIADTSDFGVLRIIVDDTYRALEVLSKAGFSVTVCEMLVAEIGDDPGGLHAVLESLDQMNVDVEYLYSFTYKYEYHVLMFVKVSDPELVESGLIERGHSVLTDPVKYGLKG